MTHQNRTNSGDGANDPLFRVLMQLDEWRHLPAYQLERRVDVLFGMFLPEILQEQGIVPQNSSVEVIPEFPLHKTRLGMSSKEGNLSVNVDFAVFCWSETNLDSTC